ncbi:GNAT family N-acetyltransferase [Gloeocapsopsis dulcis]|uniref:GNAT family N-acetyltransferase n=1 Tax=Gloeocapsopsis dulcis AAB1 = 1H9 TaxID=1433147 RepID=A0A6N8FYC5_9CHRO|nr:GNAT family N-acetyltransferase [Gloeocapsopsis dulcis]MUL37764.1 GNAT family N-acetyltransferase [Gloeocapsopsis dulcis AAB1 = 1H9]WNN90616.1 GNAT family N-acetyltransferase [Gloeocapsopsis dulcis]
MLKIIQVQTEEHKKHIYKLLEENLNETYLLVKHEFNLTFDVDVLLKQDLIKMSQFALPLGRLLLAEYNDNVAGCLGLRKIGEEVGEIKRMYVRPEYRGKRVGRALVQAIISEAQQIGYSKLCLDCAPFAKAAQALYYSVGFQSIQPYPESEIPEEYHSNWTFMELIIK